MVQLAKEMATSSKGAGLGESWLPKGNPVGKGSDLSTRGKATRFADDTAAANATCAATDLPPHCPCPSVIKRPEPWWKEEP